MSNGKGFAHLILRCITSAKYSEKLEKSLCVRDKGLKKSPKYTPKNLHFINSQKLFPISIINQHIRMISEGSRDKTDVMILKIQL